MIKLKSLLKEVTQPDPSLGAYLLENRVEEYDGWLYHGTPPEGLKEILAASKIYGNQHGEVSEHDTFSTSINSEVLHLFSEVNGDTGLQFKVKGIRVLILDDIMQYLVTRLAGSGMSIDVDEEELNRFCQQFKVPSGAGYYKSYYLPWDYISNLGIDAFCYDYVWKRMHRGYSGGNRDESEICFVSKGIDKLNHAITGIYVHNEEYEPDQKAEIIAALEQELAHD